VIQYASQTHAHRRLHAMSFWWTEFTIRPARSPVHASTTKSRILDAMQAVGVKHGGMSVKGWLCAVKVGALVPECI